MSLSKKDIRKIIGKEKPESMEEHIQLVEYCMGMSVEDFHKGLDERITPELLQEAQDNFTFLQKWLEDGKPIETTRKKNRKELVLQDGEYFVPCFDPDKPVRNELPIFWFYSNFDNLVSVRSLGKKGKKKVYWLPPKENKSKNENKNNSDKRGCQKWMHPVTKQNKSIKAYSLGALIFNDKKEIFGMAKIMLELFGVYAYGNKNDPFNLQGHHKFSCKNAPGRIYDHTNIETIDVMAHELLRKIRTAHKELRRYDSDSKKLQLEAELMHSIPSVLNAEVPGKITMIVTGDRYDLDGRYRDNKGDYYYRILAGDESPLSEEQREYIRNLSQSIQTMLAMD